MTDQNFPQAPNFILYTAANGDIHLNVVLRDETVWLTQKAMSEMFAADVPAINKHLKNIFESGAKVHKSACKKKCMGSGLALTHSLKGSNAGFSQAVASDPSV